MRGSTVAKPHDTQHYISNKRVLHYQKTHQEKYMRLFFLLFFLCLLPLILYFTIILQHLHYLKLFYIYIIYSFWHLILHTPAFILHLDFYILSFPSHTFPDIVSLILLSYLSWPFYFSFVLFHYFNFIFYYCSLHLHQQTIFEHGWNLRFSCEARDTCLKNTNVHYSLIRCKYP